MLSLAKFDLHSTVASHALKLDPALLVAVAMNQEDLAAFMSGLIAPRPTTIPVTNQEVESDDGDDIDSTDDEENAQDCHKDNAPPQSPGSDAPTVSPEHSPRPKTPPSIIQRSLRPRRSIPRAVINNGSSDDETLSPDAQSPARQDPLDLSGITPNGPAEVVAYDDRGITGWEDDRAQSASLWPAPQQYPRLTKETAIFGADEEHAETEPFPLTEQGGVLPGNIARFLHAYQRDGVRFLYKLYQRGRGGILADSMGLGKTVQVITFLGAVFDVWDRKGSKPSGAKILVVVPTSVTMNWVREFETWTPFRVEVFKMPFKRRLQDALKSDSVDVIVSGEHALRTHIDSFFKNPLEDETTKWNWNMLVVDEIHVAKNRKSQMHRAISEVPATAKYGMTGTAIQNNLTELWALMSLVVPKSLWPSFGTFNDSYILPIERGAKRGARPHIQQRAQRRIDALRTSLGKHMLRRPKSIVSSKLPGKTDYCVMMRMQGGGLQAKMYRQLLESYDVKMLRDAKTACDCGSGLKSMECCHKYPNTELKRKHAPLWVIQHETGIPCKRCPQCLFLRVMHSAQKIAMHALLIQPEADEKDEERARHRELLSRYYMDLKPGEQMRPMLQLERDKEVSCKLNVALRLVRHFREGKHKTIIFYESLRLGNILHRWATMNGIVFEVIDGSVSKEARQQAVDKFNSDSFYSVFMISKKAGGTGLNISSASRVLIFEPCWNPSYDAQAQHRAHRLGQKKEVKVYRLLTENTIEHYVFKTALKKSQLSGAILDNTEEHWQIGEEEIGSARAMLTIGEDQWTRNEQEDGAGYHIVATTKLEDEAVILDNEEGSEDSWDDTPQTESRDKTWNLDDTIGAEDVELDEEWIKLAQSDGNSKQSFVSDDDEEDDDDDDDEEDEENKEKEIAHPPQRRRRRKVVTFEEDEESEENEDKDVTGMEESQFVEEEILECDRAGRQLVMFSTSIGKKKEQVMGEEREEGGGIENDNIDDAKWVAPPATQAVSDDEEEIIRPPLRRSKRGHKRKEIARTIEAVQLDCSADEEEALNREEPLGGILPEVKSSSDEDKAVLLKNKTKSMVASSTSILSMRKRASPDLPNQGTQQMKKVAKAKAEEKRKPKKYEDPEGEPKSAFAARARVRRM